MKSGGVLVQLLPYGWEVYPGQLIRSCISADIPLATRGHYLQVSALCLHFVCWFGTGALVVVAYLLLRLHNDKLKLVSKLAKFCPRLLWMCALLQVTFQALQIGLDKSELMHSQRNAACRELVLA